jgi:hypothetical protein
MIIDHVGYAFFPQVVSLRILGRLAFPIYAYMIAEGCTYTKNRKRYLASILSMGILFQLVYLVFMRSLYQGILITFSLSIGLIYSIDVLIHSDKLVKRLLMILPIMFISFYGLICPELLEEYGFSIDYNIFGILLPVFIYFAPTKPLKLIFCAFVLIIMSSYTGFTQWFSLLTIPLLALYSGRRGKAKMKYFFYIAYPLHFVIIYVIMFAIRILK